MFVRNPLNPIITIADLPIRANTVFNPGATRLRDGVIALLLRVEDRRGFSSIYVARSNDGYTNWSVDPEPLLQAMPGSPCCEWGFEDARVCYVNELDRYVITCTAFGPPGPCVYLAVSFDLTTIERQDVVIAPEDKNAALFPRRIGGEWLLLHRPVTMVGNTADIWVSRSDDLQSWRRPEPVMLRRAAGWWDNARIGIGPPPIETAEGWLQIYHGVRNTASGAIYRVGAALLDLEEPWVVTHRLHEWIMSPTEPYELRGDVNNIVFPGGTIEHDDQLDMYYGAADTVVGVATASISEILAALRRAPVLAT